MSCDVCGLLVGLKTNPLLTPSETPYEAGARRGVLGGFALAELVTKERRYALNLCDEHRRALDESRRLLAGVLEARR